MITLRIGILVGAMLAAGAQAAAAQQAPMGNAPNQDQCRWEPPAQFGPRATPRPAAWTCAAGAQRDQKCGHYEFYWPHWLAERALPPVRQWVSERC